MCCTVDYFKQSNIIEISLFNEKLLIETKKKNTLVLHVMIACDSSNSKNSFLQCRTSTLSSDIVFTNVFVM